jgi:choice-of-anchor A domain-containing protein
MTRGTRPRSSEPLRRAVAAVTAATLALAGAVVLVTGPQAAPSFAAVGQCPDPGEFPGIGNLPPVFTDNNVAVYTGGNFLATGSASEAEGVLVVGGDATFDRTLSGSSFNVGTVGAGSQIAPDPGTVMLHVGGTLDVVAPTNVIVGAGYQDQGGGDVQVGATKTGTGTVDTNGGELRPNLGAENALAPFGDFGDQVTQASTAFAGLTGTPVAVAGNIATFDGSSSSALHVFTVDAAALNGVNELNFNGFTDGAPIVINVVGGPVDFQPNYFAADNVRFDDFSSPDFGNWASRIMWNVVDADAVQLGPAGAAQFMGSVMAPAADVQLYNHMNGRVYVGGDLTFGGAGSQSGLEIHNYPWIGPGPFNCVPTSSFVVQKTVTGTAAADVPAGTVFTVHYSYVTPAPDSETGEGDLEVPLNGNLVAGPDLPVGTVVTLSEPTLPEVDGVSWGSPVFRVNGDVVSDPASFTVVEGTMLTVSVVNTANVGGPVGGFSAQKAPLQGNAAGAVDPATEYQVDWTATLPEGATYDGDLSGTLTVLAGGAVVDGPQDLPVGTTVTFTEVSPDPVDGVVWATPVVEPSTVTVGEGQNTLVTVTNTATSQVGGFTVVKIVDGDAAGRVPGGTAFTVSWTAEIPDGVVYEGETAGEGVILADGTVYAGPVDLPVGTVVTFTEVAPPVIDGVVWGAPSISPAELTVGQGQPAIVQVTNTASTVNGGFTLQKALLGNAAGAVPGDTEFLVDWAATLPTGVTYGGPLAGTLTVLRDGTVVDGPQDLPVGTVVTFAEQTPLPEIDGVQWGSPIISPESLVVSENGGQPVAVTVTNVATSVDGGFTLQKALAGNAAGAVPDDTEFLVDWSAVLPAGVTYDGALSGTLTVLADGTVVDGPQNLPVGTTVAFSEQTPPPAVPNVVWGEPSFDPGAEITITENGGEAVGITLTNTATSTVGGFAVAKDVVGDAEGLVPGTTPFQVTWVATLPAGVTYDGSLIGTLTVLADGAVVDGPQDLPVGTTVTFSETTLPVIPDVVWGDPSFDPATLTVTETGDTPTLVTVTNTASSVVGGFTLQKDVQGNAAGIVPDITTFTVTWTAVLPPDVTYDGPLAGTLTVRADGTVVDGPTDLPVGTVVTFSEQTPLPEVGDVVWGPPSFDPAQLTVTENDGDPVAVVVTNTANTVVGSFGVAKALAGNAAGLVPRDTAFLVDWSADVPDGVDYDGDVSGTLTVLADGTIVDGPTDLPVGTVVTLSEQSPLPEVDGVVWGTPSYDPGTTVTIAENAGAPAVVTLTNTASTVDGGFSVAKALTGNAAGLVPGDTAFLVDWSAVLPDGVTYAGPLTGTVTVLADGTVAAGPQDLPVGSTVTFTERAPLPPVDGVVWGTPTFAPGTELTITENGGAPVTVTVTNTATSAVGGFTVHKALAGNAAGAVPTGTEFQVDWTAELPTGVTYDGDLSGTLTVLADGTAVDGPVDLPVGTVVTFAEQTPLPDVPNVVWGTPELTPGAQVTIVEGAAGVELTVTNTATSVVGGFSLQKSVIGDAAGIVPDDTAFSVTWVATLPPDVTYDGFLTGTLTVLADGTVVDGPQVLPAGTTVTFTEATPPVVPGVTWGAVSVDPAQLTITENAGEPAAVTVTNTANAVTGSFGVAKALAGNAAGVVPDDVAFLVDWSATLPDGVAYPGPLTGTLTVLADGTIADGPADLPVGTVVTFAEQTPLPDVPNVVWGTPEISPESVTVAEGDDPVVVTVTNTATSAVGGFAVAKALAGNAAGVVPDDTEFLVSWSATLPDGVTYEEALTGTLTVLADGTVVDGPQDLPVGTVVTFVETGLPSVPDVEWGTPVFSPESVTITETGDAPTEVTVTNTATSVVGGFSLQKVVDGDSTGVVPADTAFLVDWTATVPDGVTYDGATEGTLTVLADGTVVAGPQDLPARSVVTLVERTPLPEVPGVLWGEPAFAVDGVAVDPATLTVVAGTAVAVTLTNTANDAHLVGGFAVHKVVDGSAAGRVPDDTAFTVTWTADVPGGTLYAGPTSGRLTVRADGTVVTGPADLPEGTVVTLGEVDLPGISGVRWGTPVFAVGGERTTELTVAVGEVADVTLTNTASTTGGLAVTGATTGGLVGLGALLVLGGAALLAVTRRRRTA